MTDITNATTEATQVETAMTQAFSEAAAKALEGETVQQTEKTPAAEEIEARKTASYEKLKDVLQQPKYEREYDNAWSVPEQEEKHTEQTQSDESQVDTVLDKVEERINQPRQRHQRRPEAASSDKLNALADQFKKPAKGRAALFELPSDRPASQLLKNIFDSSTMDGVDGVDHINIHNNAATELGKFLDMNSYSPFVHPDAGNFQSVGGLWHYIQTRPVMEEFRILSGARVRAQAKKMKEDAKTNPNAPRHVSIKGFRTIIADAMWHKVTQNANAVRMMAESNLPFEHYFSQGDLGIRQYPSEGYWICAAYEEIRRVIKHRLATGNTDAQPDFSAIENLVDTRNMSAPRPQVRRESAYGHRTARR